MREIIVSCSFKKSSQISALIQMNRIIFILLLSPGGWVITEEFCSQEIDGQALLLLTEDHLVSTMNLKLGPALKLCAHINSLKEAWAFNILLRTRMNKNSCSGWFLISPVKRWSRSGGYPKTWTHRFSWNHCHRFLSWHLQLFPVDGQIEVHSERWAVWIYYLWSFHRSDCSSTHPLVSKWFQQIFVSFVNKRAT